MFVNRRLIVFLFLITPAICQGGVQFASGNDDTLDAGTQVPNPASDDQYTLSAWIYTTNATSTQTIVARSSFSTNAFPFAMGLGFQSGARKLACIIRVNPGSENTAFSSCGGVTNECIATNRWYHVACGYGGGRLKAYINGARVANPAVAISSTYTVTTDGSLNIGGYVAGGRPFEGKITDVTVYRRDLSIDEIQTLAFSRKRNLNTDGVFGYWPIDEGSDNQDIPISGSHVIDRSGNGNHASLDENLNITDKTVYFAEEYISR